MESRFLRSVSSTLFFENEVIWQVSNCWFLEIFIYKLKF
jgi:hypothetical protein